MGGVTGVSGHLASLPSALCDFSSAVYGSIVLCVAVQCRDLFSYFSSILKGVGIFLGFSEFLKKQKKQSNTTKCQEIHKQKG